jgi:hypothetical protein
MPCPGSPLHQINEASITHQIAPAITPICLPNHPLRPSPITRHMVPIIHPRKKLFLQPIKRSSRHPLIHTHPLRKRLLGHAAILELREHHLLLARQQRTRRVPVIHGCRFFARAHRKKISHKDWRLRRYRRDGFRCRQAGRVANGPDVCEFLVLRRGVRDVDVAGGVGDAALRDEGVRFVLGRNVQEVEVARDILVPRAVERRRVAVDSNEVVFEESLNAALHAQLVECSCVLGHAEHTRQPRGKRDVDRRGRRGVVQPGVFPVVQRKPHYFLRRTGALDDAGGLCRNTRTSRLSRRVHLD